MAADRAVVSGPQKGIDRRQAVKALEDQLARTSRALRPHEHAALAYRLGLAYAESPVGDTTENLRKALASYEVASSIFDPRHDPVEHARVLNAAGAAHRALGARRRAAGLFGEAARLLEGRGRDQERAAILNNLGLARVELGELDRAVAACDEAVALFDTDTEEGRRSWAATLHTRGMAHAAMGTEEGLEAALADYEEALADLDRDQAPYHHGLMHHSVGVTCTSLARLRPTERERLLREAIRAFEESLTVFTRTELPFQHALAKHNLGLAHSALGGAPEQRRALACFEDAVALLDTRLHAEAWRQAYNSLSRVEEELNAGAPEPTRADHFVAMVVDADPGERVPLVKERLARLVELPDPRRRAALAELALASARLVEYERARTYMEAELSVLIELPTESLEVGLRSRLEGHRRVEPGSRREQADLALDQAIGDALQGPQRISVRDYLYSLGYERP